MDANFPHAGVTSNYHKTDRSLRMRRWKFGFLVVLAALLGLPATQAQATGPALLSTTPGDGATGQSRYGMTVTFTYDQPVVSAPIASLTRIGTGTVVPVTTTVDGATVTLKAETTSLVSSTAYIASVLLDPESTADTATFTTLRPPLHPAIRAKIITALDPQATDDIVRRFDRTNLLAVPRPQDLVDISLATGRPLTGADLTGYHTALVVTDRDVTGQDAAATVLAAFCSHGHGVAVAGQTHWKQGPLWSAASAISTSYASSWASQWSPYGLTDAVAVEGGSLAGTVSSHFVTRYLRTPFTVIGHGSGEYYTETPWNAAILARLAKTAAFPTWGQALVAVRTMGTGRVVDLGYRPWSSAIAGGGFDPAVTPGGGLLARSLWWASNRIPPTSTRFTSKPASSTWRTTVSFTFAGTDPDDTSLRFRYRVNSGLWKWSPSATLVLFNLAARRTYRIQVFAVDPAGNRYPSVAQYTFRVTG
jgi:hypothetical protein